jgi:hypothetical protein
MTTKQDPNKEIVDLVKKLHEENYEFERNSLSLLARIDGSTEELDKNIRSTAKKLQMELTRAIKEIDHAAQKLAA